MLKNLTKSGNSQEIEHPKNKILSILKTRLSLECSSPASNKSARQLRENQSILSDLSFVPLVFLQNACLLNTGLEHCRSDLVFEQSRLRNTLFSERSIRLKVREFPFIS